MDGSEEISPLRILLVDDSVHDFQAFKRAFERSDVACDITYCQTAEQALERLLRQADSFDLLVTDYKLPGMTGLELCRELLRLEIPLTLVMLTGSGTENIAVEAMKLGVDDYLIKDPKHGYFQLLPVVLPEAVRRHSDRLVRRLTEEQLKTSEERLKLALEATTDGLWDWNVNTGQAHFSSRYYTMLGYEPDEFEASYESWAEMIHPQDREGTVEKVQGWIEQRGKAFEVEFRLRTKDDRWKWILSRGKVVRWDSDGRPIRVVGTHTDITGRKKAEEQREALLHAMGERNKELACMYRVAKSIRDRTNVAEILQDVASCIPAGWQYPRITRGKVRFESDEFLSEPFQETEWKQTADIVVNGKRCGSIEVYYLQERPELDEGPFMTEERNLIEGIARAVSEGIERKEAQQQIENLARFPSENPNPVLRVAADGELLYANEASAAILRQWQCQEGRKVPSPWIGTVSDALSSGSEKRVDVEYSLRAYSFCVAPVCEANYANFYVRDITERKRSEKDRQKLMDDLEAKNKELQHFSSIIRHDFGNPLLSIRAFTEELVESTRQLRSLLEAEHIDIAARDRLMSILTDDICPDTDFIASAAEQMSRLLEGLKHLAAVGHVAVNIEPVDMNDVVGRIVGSMKFQIEQANAVVNIGNLPPCLADQGQVRQVFANILGNAIKYLDHRRAGIVEVRGQVREGMSVYCVEDNGIGISAEHRDKVFDIFHRVGVKENIEGEGLGLSIVMRILERLGGAVRLESEPGEGSRFSVSLPTVRIREVAQTP